MDIPHFFMLPEAGYTPTEMMDHFGMQFSETNTPGGLTAKDLIQLGWKAPDLFRAGLQTLEQYDMLAPDGEDERTLGINVAGLITTQPQPQIQLQPIMVQYVPAPVIQQPHPIKISAPKFHHGLKKK
jgi:hypothetical protein